MAKKKRYRRSKAVSAPRRPARRSLTTSPRRKKRKSLSEMNIVKGKMGEYINPAIEGGAGGGVTALALDMIPENWIDDPDTKDWIERGVLGATFIAAVFFKQKLVAAGVAGAAVYREMQKAGVLQEGARRPARRSLRSTRFADPNLLSMGDGNLLSGSRRVYPQYKPLYSRRSRF